MTYLAIALCVPLAFYLAYRVSVWALAGIEEYRTGVTVMERPLQQRINYYRRKACKEYDESDRKYWQGDTEAMRQHRKNGESFDKQADKLEAQLLAEKVA
jgi:hypothetical protein